MRTLLLFAVVFSLGLAGPAFAEKRVALVIGNSAYQNVTPLDNPANDAVLMAETLKDIGFSVTGEHAQLNLDKRTLDEAIEAFGKQVQGADVALFYYAGHGVQVRGTNYLVPTGANPTREADVDWQMVSIDAVLRQMEGTRLNIVVLDACRNNPFGGRGLRSANGGLAQLQAPDGTLISYATQPGNVAQDGSQGHSPYTIALAAALKRPGSELFKTFNEVGLAVKKSTGGTQQPWVSSSPIDGTFYFTGSQANAGANDAPAPREPVKPPTEVVATLTAPTKPQSEAEIITDCDRLAANLYDPQRPRGVTGLRITEIDVTRAAPACDQAMRQHPDIARFIYQAGRVAQMQKDYASAKQLYEKAAAAGYTAGYVNVGVLYAQGSGVPQDYSEARNWYDKAAALNDPAAFNAIGFMYETGKGAPKDYAEARKWYEKAVASGLTTATIGLGRLYQAGNGVPTDPGKARGLFETAAAAGEPVGMRSLGLLYDRGTGAPQDFAEARKWYEKAAAAGDATAMNNLGIIYEYGKGVPKDYAEAKKWYDKAIAGGLKLTLVNLGHLYEEGSGVPMDPGKARSLFEEAAAAGEPTGMRSLGFLFDRGIGAPQDFAEARKWYEKAAAGGDASAMNGLGVLYEYGHGVDKDLAVAKLWYEKAAALGQVFALTNLGNLYRDGRGVTKDYTQARSYYEKAAAGGRGYAMTRLGEFYQQGWGVTKDLTRARKWYEMAVAAGDASAAQAISQLDNPVKSDAGTKK